MCLACEDEPGLVKMCLDGESVPWWGNCALVGKLCLGGESVPFVRNIALNICSKVTVARSDEETATMWRILQIQYNAPEIVQYLNMD